MPGANYMGGKRSAMKARVKDTVGRQQKGFFGRQRLDMLSQGLAASKPSERSRSPVAPSSRMGPLSISLAHAKQRPSDHSMAARSFIPSPIHISPSTPRSRRHIRRTDAHTSSSKKSEILDKLDTSEPLFIRRIMDQILAMPDLACLPSCGTSKVARIRSEPSQKDEWSDRESSPVIRGKRKRSDDEQDKSSSRGKLELKEESWPMNEEGRAMQETYTPPRKKQMTINDNNGYLNYRTSPYSSVKDSKKTSREALSIEIFQNEEEAIDGNGNFHDSGFTEFFGDDSDEGLHSSSWSIQQHKSPAQGSHHRGQTQQKEWESFSRYLESDNDRDDTTSSPSPRGRQREGKDKHPNEQPRNTTLPSCIRLGPGNGYRYMDHTDQSDVPTVYGSLFEQEDPWSTIGAILGLPDADVTGRVPVSTSKSFDREILDNGQASPITKHNMPEEDKEEDEEDHVDSGKFESESLSNASPVSGPSMDVSGSRTSEILSSIDDKTQLYLCESPESDMQSNQKRSSSLSAIQESLDEEVDRLLRQEEGEEVASLVVHATGVLPVGRNLSLEEKIRSDQEEEQGRVNDDTALSTMPHRCDSVEGSVSPMPDIVNVPDDSENGPDVLAMPNLRKVNGRFLGPSLFDVFNSEESEDEW